MVVRVLTWVLARLVVEPHSDITSRMVIMLDTLSQTGDSARVEPAAGAEAGASRTASAAPSPTVMRPSSIRTMMRLICP